VLAETARSFADVAAERQAARSAPAAMVEEVLP
jgi:hypothetical protein